MNPAVVVQISVVLLREAMEAVIVLLAVASLLRRVTPARTLALWIGAVLGLLASLLIGGVYASRPPSAYANDAEGITCLLAAGLMLWVGGWLWRQTDPRTWDQTLERTAWQALGARRAPLALGFVGFLAVFREGVETALFLAALGRHGAPADLWGGVAFAVLVLLVLWQIAIRTTIRLPLRPMFQITSVVLLITAAQLAFDGMQHFRQ
ncbi:FTR1 family protein [Paeniroseomonas aquatica]|jgi:high-affinity iron transporter|uniref:FTR1 family protein n=1 Tax=Paeniroseomonas aquatica TaxID=373043 RepID=A0ABT8A4R0_9PROT|nr:FTR1 family protein [Paeniroseomonas aquatica]MDN3564663.1 FTR1 family protein [Paeniroseomonas aquatica]